MYIYMYVQVAGYVYVCACYVMYSLFKVDS